MQYYSNTVKFVCSLQIIDATCTCSCPSNYQLTVHNKCECVANAPCTANKNWNRDTCQCECNTAEICHSNQRWNNQTCQCQCLIFQLCDINRVWNSDTCSCECRYIKDCRPNQWWNSQTCSCECFLFGECNEEQVLNRDTCSCECSNSCPPGGFIPNTCKCLGLGLEDIEGKWSSRIVRLELPHAWIYYANYFNDYIAVIFLEYYGTVIPSILHIACTYIHVRGF